MTQAKEIITSRSLSGHWWARYAGGDDVLTKPNGYGHTEEDARANLAIDEAYLAKNGSLWDEE